MKGALIAGVAAASLIVTACSGADGGGAPSDGATGGESTAPTSPASGATPTTAPASPTTSAQPTQEPEGGQMGALPTQDELDAAREDVSALSTEQLAGQLIVAMYPGTEPQGAAGAVEQNGLGGVIVMGSNVPDDPGSRVDAMSGVAEAVNQTLQDDGRDWPAFVSVDQEGGPVARLGDPFTGFPGGMAHGAANDAQVSQRVGLASGEELRAAGFTVVFAPDADATIGPDDPTIGVRSPSSDVERVSQAAVGLAQGYAEAGIVSSVKHFPGHGSLTVDSHKGLPEYEGSLEDLEERDLVPFREAVDAGVPMVMVGHIVVPDIDAEKPATLSKKVITGLLREDMGFEGLVVTDALDMGAITEMVGPDEAVVQTLEAGSDVALMPTDAGAARDAVVQAVEDGRLTREDLETKAARMVATLRHHEQMAQPPGQDVIGAHGEDATALALGSLTQVEGECGAAMVTDAVQVRGGTGQDRRRFEEAAQDAGLDTTRGPVVTLLGGGAYQAGSGEQDANPSGSGDVVVALDVPYGLDGSSAQQGMFAAYGRTPATFAALVEVLKGEAEPGGSLPVQVGDHEVGHTVCQE